MPTSAMASSAARRQSAWIWPLLRSCTSSIRAGWIRPSLTSSVKVIRAVSRRTGSKQDSRTDSGVSSIITLTPVTCSKARMLRPSRPMIRPFMSSPGRWTAETTDSEVCSDATRWMAPTTIIWARQVASRAACRSMSRATRTACRLASCSTAATSSAFACSAVSPAIRSRVDCCSASISASGLALTLQLGLGAPPRLELVLQCPRPRRPAAPPDRTAAAPDAPDRRADPAARSAALGSPRPPQRGPTGRRPSATRPGTREASDPTPRDPPDPLLLSGRTGHRQCGPPEPTGPPGCAVRRRRRECGSAASGER